MCRATAGWSTNFSFFPEMDNIGSIFSSRQCWVEGGGAVYGVRAVSGGNHGACDFLDVRRIFAAEKVKSSVHHTLIASPANTSASKTQLTTTIIRPIPIHHHCRQYRIHEQSFIMMESFVISTHTINHHRILPYHYHRHRFHYHYHAGNTSEQFI